MSLVTPPITPPPTSSSSQSSSTTPSSSSSSSSISSSSNPSLSRSSSSSLSTPDTSTLSTPSTSVWQTTAVMTSNGQAYTSVITVTSLVPPGTVITTNANANSHVSKSNVGAIVGGVVGGIGGAILIVLLISFFLRRRRNKLEFDGNFDPDHVTSKRNQGYAAGAGATLPRMDLADEEMMEDDGMGGRLGAGAGGGGIISPYAYQPAAPVGTASGVGAAAGLAAAPVQRHQRNPSYGQQQQQQYYDYATSNSNPPSSPIASGMSSEGGYPATHHTTSSGSNYPYVNPMGRGPSPGPSVLTGNGQGGSSEHSSGGIPASAYGGGIMGVGAVLGQHGNEQQRSAKEMEAMGMRAPHVMNPDDAAAAAAGYYPPGVHSQTRQSYLQNGPIAASGSQQQQFYAPSAAGAGSSSVVPDALRPGAGPLQSQSHYASASMSSTGSSPPPMVRPGSAVVVHQDGGRVVMRKGEQVDEEEEEGAGLSEIPPTYDSLVHGGHQGSSSSPGERGE